MFLFVVNSIKGISLKDIKIKKDDNSKLDLKMFSRINFESENENPKKNEDKIYIIRNKLVKYFLNKKTIILLIAVLFLITYLTSFEIGGIYLILITMTYTFLIYYPQIKEKNSYSDLNQELPYALRHMSIELKSGKGLHDTMLTIKNSDYGSISKEFTRVLEEIKFGKQTEESLQEMSHRVNSEGLSRTIHQIIGTLRVGGNLANSLDIIAKDISFETQIKLKEYSQKLNSFILIYTFIAILAPVIILIMLMAGSTVMGDVISGNLLILIYSLFFPLVIMLMGIFIKKLEPKI
ncbi:MAG: type II secretion system F family protein [Methanobrevibacter sp.]|uniref:type II secretion system F family protein n=1 Tax=Methanobrevibacter sp. TaxID=66852 RepID=UPI002E7956E4|nr:type II secretion system F family protein [Methanobrevibacter sp.]MEE0942549.1 type II secretion system F family protein [Methanobrevibacter sp.]